MRLCLLLMFFLACVGRVTAQNLPVQISIRDSKGNPVEFAAVSLFRDSTRRLGNVTDSLGFARFVIDSAGNYFIKITAIGYKTIEQSINISSTEASFSFNLAISGTSLNEVVILKKKPLIRQEDDKTIIDPEQLAESSSNGYEILEKTPGLFVDQDGNIYLSSTTPALVFINGRELKMSRADIASMLKSLPPNSIEKIEIIRTPSAKYDASGSGGIVNVVLKKGVKIGLNGSVRMGAQQGVYGNQNIGFNLSNNNGKASSYFNANFALQNNYQQINTDRVLFGDTILSQKAFTKYPGKNAFTNFGLNKDLNDKLNFSYDARLSYTNGKADTKNSNDIVNKVSEDVLGNTQSDVQQQNHTFLLDQQLATTLKLDTSGSEWNNQLSYTFSSGNVAQQYQNASVLGTNVGDGESGTGRHNVVFQSDLIRKANHQFTFEAGIKSGLLLFRNDAQYFTGSNSAKLVDYSRTSRYNYTEMINATYVQGSKGFSGFLLKTGVRMENTNMVGNQTVPGDTSFKIHRTDLFPYIYFSRKIMAIAGYDLRAYLVYRRTVSRPSYDQLNPFPKYVDQFMSEVGNPSLKPQFTQNYEANVSVNDHPLLAVGYNDTKDIFTDVFYQADSNVSQAYRSTDNIGKNREYYLRGFAAIPPGGRYFAVVGGQYNHNVYEGLYQGQPLNFTGDSWLFFTYQQLRIDKKSAFTINGFWRLAGPLQFYQLSQMGSLTASLNRKFMKGKLTVAINVTDIFYSNNNRFVVKQGSVDATGSRATDSRRAGFSLNYNFGIRKKEENMGMFDIGAEGSK